MFGCDRDVIQAETVLGYGGMKPDRFIGQEYRRQVCRADVLVFAIDEGGFTDSCFFVN
jgi:hypothetical protein